MNTHSTVGINSQNWKCEMTEVQRLSVVEQLSLAGQRLHTQVRGLTLDLSEDLSADEPYTFSITDLLKLLDNYCSGYESVSKHLEGMR